VCKKNEYPITHYEKRVGNDTIENFQQLRNWLDLNLNLLDYEILNAEYQMMKNGDFKPNVERLNPEVEDNNKILMEMLSKIKTEHMSTK